MDHVNGKWQTIVLVFTVTTYIVIQLVHSTGTIYLNVASWTCLSYYKLERFSLWINYSMTIHHSSISIILISPCICNIFVLYFIMGFPLLKHIYCMVIYIGIFYLIMKTAFSICNRFMTYPVVMNAVSPSFT